MRTTSARCISLDLLLRLMAQELRVRENGQEVSYRNTPADRIGYEMFRRVVSHLSAIQDQNQFHAEPLVYNRTWTIPANSVTAEGFQALQKEYLVTYSQKDNSYTLRKQITGQILITNYDLDTLSPDERARLVEETEEGQLNDVSFDIRPGHVGGEYPLKGDFRLRSFNTILNFLCRSLGDDPEYHVDKDPRTPAVQENPVHTMELLLSDGAPLGTTNAGRCSPLCRLR